MKPEQHCYTAGFIKLLGLLNDLKLNNEPRFKLIYWNCLLLQSVYILGNRSSKYVVNNCFDPRQCDSLYARML